MHRRDRDDRNDLRSVNLLMAMHIHGRALGELPVGKGPMEKRQFHREAAPRASAERGTHGTDF